jgi:hypothetical protein
MLQDQACHDAKPVQGEFLAGDGQFSPRDVSPLRQPLLAELEGAEHEQIGTLVEPLLAHADSIHDAIAEG